MADTDIKSIFDTEPDDAEQAGLDAKAMDDYRAGRVVPHAKVVEWLDTWGSTNVPPPPKPDE